VIVSCLSEGNSKRIKRSEAKDDLSKRKKERNIKSSDNDVVACNKCHMTSWASNVF
jgi:hypothetical protein